MTWRALLAVAAGGLLGTLLRLGVDVALPHGDAAFPVATLSVNVLGSLVLGFLAGGLWARASTPDWLKAGLGTGLIGSFTTFSALAVSLTVLAASGEWVLAALYLASTLLLGFAAAALGLWLGARVTRAPLQVEITDAGVDL